ncbi:hypothetical protein [Peredibacter starrii]|uniref:N-acetyltransferase domain-containing protein n=1 Tax=Peredibacter starrii TaxID=28202 RepID=A0AAX4HP61_9BACT|nr:hypothetical protein [Peredibacter starrii]WPU64985.1 hypothetical protein SOO65_20015 [Peredibacter starrii]
MNIQSVDVWDETFFTEFVNFRNKIHRDIEVSFPETNADYSRFFGPDSVFLSDFSWTAVMVKSDKVLAKGILSWRKGTNQGNLGFLDWENNEEAAKILIKEIEQVAKKNNLTVLKTPIDLNFFVKYRIRVPGGEKPVWGEPVYPDYYHDLFEKTGFKEIGRWDTYRLKKIQGIIDYFLKRKKLAVKPTGSHSKTKNKGLRTTIRCVRMNEWENELKIIHQLFTEAYKNMPEFETISFEQFKVIYDDFKYIIHPWYAYIVELRGKPVGFSINFADPLPILSQYKGKKPNLIQKAWIMARLRMNMSCFMIAHVGKIPGPNGEEIKGVQIQASKRIQFWGALMRKVLVTFQHTNSPSRRSFEEKSQTTYAQYVLYGKDL